MNDKWKKYLSEDAGGMPQIYCDMDGVLVDFEQGIVQQINSDLKMLEARGSDKKLEALRAALSELGRDYVTIDDLRGKSMAVKSLRNYMYARVGDDEEFWANLPWTENGRELWSYISQFKPYILTSPMQKGSERGKEMWIKINLDPIYKPERIHMHHQKYRWAKEDGRPNILIDDWTKNTVPWANSGGIAILHRDSNLGATLESLQQAMEGDPLNERDYQKESEKIKNYNKDRHAYLGTGANKYTDSGGAKPSLPTTRSDGNQLGQLPGQARRDLKPKGPKSK